MAEKCEKLLPFPINNAGKYKYLVPIETMIVNKYFDCMNKLCRYDNKVYLFYNGVRCDDVEITLYVDEYGCVM